MKKRHSIFIRSAIVFTAVVTVSLITTYYLLYSYNVQRIQRETAQDAKAVASVSAQLIETLDFDDLQQSDTSEVYTAARQILRSICQSFDLEYLYLYTVDEEQNSIRYIMAVAADDAKDETVALTCKLNTAVKHELTEQEKAALYGDEDETVYITDNDYGNVFSWFYPLQNKDGETIALIGCDFRTEDIYAKEARTSILLLLPAAFGMLFVLVIFLVFLHKKVFAPVKKISGRMNSFVEDRNRPSVPLSIRSGDEIQEIADSFEKMSEDISTYIAQIENLITKSVQAKVQMDVASRIQTGIVPPETSLSAPNYSVCAFARPAKAVGGDFYDCFERKDGSLCIVIGDVSDKGIAAALFMVMVKTLLRNALESGSSPAQALNSVNDELCKSNPEGMFATVFAAVLDQETGSLVYANAGHTKPVMIDGKSTLLEADPGIALGLFEDAGIRDSRTVLENNSGIVLYTDGVTDAMKENKEFYQEKRMLDALENADSAQNAVESLNASVKEFVSDSEQFDDYTVLSLFYHKPLKKTFSYSSDLSVISKLRNELKELIETDSDRKKADLVCEEVLSNIVNYAKASKITAEVIVEENRIGLLFADDGNPFNPLERQSTEKDFDSCEYGGMGISIVKNSVSRMEYEYADGKNILTLELEKKKRAL